MGEKYALLVGIERYHDSARIHGAARAEQDVGDLHDALLDLGYSENNIVVLVNDRATKTAIEHHLEDFRLKRLNAEDSFLFFFAGRGFSQYGANYIACCDTYYSNLAGTSIELGEVVKDLRSSACSRLLLFLDCCGGEIVSDQTECSIVSHLTDEMIDEVLRDAERVGCFSSCRHAQKSYSSPRLKHGIWTYHLIKALRGEVPEILSRPPLLTATSLQSYLHKAVPRTIRETFTDGRQQTPWYSGGHGHEFLVADLTPIIERKRATRANELRDVVLSHDESVRVRSLAGFIPRNHKVPASRNAATERFVTRIAQGDLESDLERVFEEIRNRLNYRRKEVTVHRPDGENGGSVWTPDFQYSISVAQIEDEPSEVAITRELSEIRDPAILENEEFREIFDDVFDTARLSFSKRIDVERIIDAIESRDTDDITVDYPSDASHCTITLFGLPGTIRVTRDGLELRQPSKQTILELANSLQRIIAAMGLAEGIDKYLALPGAGG